MPSEKKGIPSLNAVLSKLTRRSETKSDSTPPSPVVGLRKAASGAIHIAHPISAAHAWHPSGNPLYGDDVLWEEWETHIP